MAGGADEAPRVAIVGAGRMGLGIAESFLLAGAPVTLADATPELARSAPERLAQRMGGQADAGLLAPDAVERALGLARTADELAGAVADADLTIECVSERLDVKHDVLRACDAAAPPDAILATNTSSFDVDALAAAVARPERFLGTHFFNPPEWTPGVEVVTGARTDPAVVERTVALLAGLGKRPSVMSSGVGFIANRLQMAMFCEAARCVEEGLAEPRDVDEVVRSCFGFRLPFFGPFQIADMAGLDVYEAIVEQHAQELGERFAVPEALRRLVRTGRCGTVAGAGFYDYPDDASQRLLVERDARYAAERRLIDEHPPPRFAGGGRAPFDGELPPR